MTIIEHDAKEKASNILRRQLDNYIVHCGMKMEKANII